MNFTEEEKESAGQGGSEQAQSGGQKAAGEDKELQEYF